MAIYRGAGGAGDAVADSSSEALLVRDLATQVQADADAAEAARAAAVTAQIAAELAETNAETAEANAETAETNAETAQAAAASSASAAASSASAAATSATNAANSATAAQTAETNAETAETNAETAETNAAASASAASTSATNASNSASSASTSATNASNSATAAATSATNANNSATAAASSASAASTSATNAANSATAASGSATSAASSASTATTQAGLASTSASNAATSESNAASSASAAATSASNAATSATNASNSASAAATSASNASTSEIAAAASAAAAAASYDSFDDRYLGAKSAAPTLDNDGNALIAGALYYNDGTVTAGDKGMYVYDGSQWIAASAASTAILVVYQYTATGGQTTFSGADNNSLTLAYTAGSALVTLNGVILEVGTEVTATSGTSVVLASGAVAGDELNVYAFSTFDIANVYTQAQSDARYVNVTGDTMTGALLLPAGTVSAPAITTTGDTNTGIFFPAADTIAFSEGGVEAMRITDIGQVGIGTSSPTMQLHVANSSGNLANFIRTGVNAGTTLNADNGGGIIAPAGGVDGLQFYNLGLSRLNMKIDSSGNLLVGTTSAGSGATYGSVYLAGDRNVGSGNYYAQAFIQHNSSTNHGLVIKELNTAGTAVGFLNSGGTVVGTIGTGASSTSYNTSSDYRLKENIAPMTGALGVVQQLKPVTYTWKADGSDGQGFIAHELQAVVPDCVTGEKDAVDAEGKPQYQGIDTSFLVATLTAAIQELKAEVDSLKSEVTALKGQE